MKHLLEELTDSTYEKYLRYAEDEISLKELLQEQAELNKKLSNAIIQLTYKISQVSNDIDSNSRNLNSLRYGTYYTG